MNYAKSYLNTRNLAAMIRESATSGKVEKAGGGLGAREKRREQLAEEPDFETIRAQYINTVQDLFKDNIQKRIDSTPDRGLMDELTGPSVLEEAPRPKQNPMQAFAREYTSLPERDLLAITIEAEAGKEGYEGMLAVGSVIDNRLKAGKFGKTVQEVLLKPGQFSAWNSVTGYAKGEQGQDMYAIKPSANAYKVADQILSGEYTSNVGGATHYVNLGVSQPSWAEGVKGQKLGNHTFMTVD